MAFDEIKRRELTRNAVALILAGGRGSRLYELTDKRVKPGGAVRRQVPHRPTSRCRTASTAGLRRIGILTQYKVAQPAAPPAARLVVPAAGAERVHRPVAGATAPRRGVVVPRHRRRGLSEHRHPGRATRPSPSSCWPATTSTRWTIRSCWPCMPTAARRARPAPIEVPRMEATAFGVMAVDESDRVTAFVEKPADPPAIPGQPDQALASMGIYVFDAAFMYEELARDGADATSSHDFGKDIMPSLVARAPRRGAPVQPQLRRRRGPRTRPIGATSARSTPTGRPTSI